MYTVDRFIGTSARSTYVRRWVKIFVDDRFALIKAMLQGDELSQSELFDEAIGNSIISYSNYLADRVIRYDEKWNDLAENLQSFCWAYPIKKKKSSVTAKSRTCPMFYGPLYTSGQYPWPMIGDRYLEPVVQFFLEHIGALGRRKLGSGLLQLWMGSNFQQYLIRIIPSELVQIDMLTTPPEVIDSQYFEESVTSNDQGSDEEEDWYGAFEWNAWPAQNKIYLIQTDFAKKLNWSTSVFHYDYENEKIEDTNLQHDIDDFLSIIPKFDLEPRTDQFFGRFDHIQYGSSGFDVLLVGESGGWGMSGNWQIVINGETDTDKKYQFLFSC